MTQSISILGHFRYILSRTHLAEALYLEKVHGGALSEQCSSEGAGGLPETSGGGGAGGSCNSSDGRIDGGRPIHAHNEPESE